MRKRTTRPAEPQIKSGDRALLAGEGPRDRGTGERPPTREEDPELWAVHDEFRRVPGAVALIAEAIRDSFDQIYDGQSTGRWDYRQLNKTEKTHVGTLVQINIHRYLTLADGEDLDYRVAGTDIDCKWSRIVGEWEIPEEMYLKNGPRLALLVWGNDYTARWSAGLLRTHEENLRPVGKQRDRKRKLNDVGNDRILWLERQGVLEGNQLLLTDEPTRRRILGQRSGQKCVDALFRNLTGQVINRASILTAAMQDDPMKRARDARKRLAPEGIVIFGHYAPHPDLAAGLGLPRPGRGSFVSARLQSADMSWGQHLVVEIEDRHWRLAETDSDVEAAPALPAQGRDSQGEYLLEPLHLDAAPFESVHLARHRRAYPVGPSREPTLNFEDGEPS